MAYLFNWWHELFYFNSFLPFLVQRKGSSLKRKKLAGKLDYG
jgi:hypothetical protein